MFHPRLDNWDDHFEYRGAILIGLSPVGEATIRLLQMNTVEQLEMRAELLPLMSAIHVKFTRDVERGKAFHSEFRRKKNDSDP